MLTLTQNAVKAIRSLTAQDGEADADGDAQREGVEDGGEKDYRHEAELDPASESGLERLVAAAVLSAPSFTIRGGTNEILRSVAARALRQ